MTMAGRIAEPTRQCLSAAIPPPRSRSHAALASLPRPRVVTNSGGQRLIVLIWPPTWLRHASTRHGRRFACSAEGPRSAWPRATQQSSIAPRRRCGALCAGRARHGGGEAAAAAPKYRRQPKPHAQPPTFLTVLCFGCGSALRSRSLHRSGKLSALRWSLGRRALRLLQRQTR